jgi:Tol biopolymer transport system component
VWPSFLPDGRHFVFQMIGGGNSGLYVSSLDSGVPKLLMQGSLAGDFPSAPIYSPPGLLLFVTRRGRLMAQPFDVERLQLTGDVFRITDGVQSGLPPGGAFSVSQNGVLAYWSGTTNTTQPTWMNRAGRSLGTTGASGSYLHVALSRDATHAALEGTGVAAGIWVLDIARGTVARLVPELLAFTPIWSPDGTSILFSAVIDTPPNLFVKRLVAAGAAERLVRGPIEYFPADWSPDGKSVVYSTEGRDTRGDLWVMPMSGDRTPTSFLQTRFDESEGRISPDGRWIAYTSDESGQSEVYVTSFPRPGRTWLVSVNGAENPVWRRDGRELYYVSADSKLMAVPVAVDPTFDPGASTPLFELRVVSGTYGWNYDVAPDGRFLVNTITDTSSPPITVVTNWLTEVGNGNPER